MPPFTMPRFKFRLTSLVTLRQGDRARCRAELAAAMAVERQFTARRAALDDRIERHRQWVRSGTSPGAIAVEMLRGAAEYDAALRAQLAEVAASQAAAAADVARCRQRVAAADSEMRALEKLRERKLDEYNRAQALEEVKRLDEICARR